MFNSFKFGFKSPCFLLNVSPSVTMSQLKTVSQTMSGLMLEKALNLLINKERESMSKLGS